MKNDLHPFVVTAIAMFLVCPLTCKCGETQPVVVADIPTVPASSGVFTSSSSTSTSYSPKEYTKKWSLVLEPDLPKVLGSWGTDDELGTWANIESRESVVGAGGKWTMPYPWHLVFKAPDGAESYDCGLFAGTEEGGWHLGYCMGGDVGKDRRARKILLRYTSEPSDMLYIELDDVSFVVDRPPRSLRPE